MGEPYIKLPFLIVAGLLAVALSPLRAATITVTTTSDSGPGSLRDALAIATDGDTIDFSVTGTILLTSGELLVTNSLTISGPGPSNLAVDGNASSRVFHIGSSTVVSISGLTITNGVVAGDSAEANFGGGIWNDHATLVLSNTSVSGNSGGGIFDDGFFGSATLTISGCTIRGNSLFGVWSLGVGGSAMLTVKDCVITGNMTNPLGGGGGILNFDGALTIGESTICSNTAGAGGGVYNGGFGNFASCKITNTIFSGNLAQADGGGIYNVGKVELIVADTTFQDNSATIGGGGAICNDPAGGDVIATVADSTLNGNSAGRGGGIANEGRGNATLAIVNSTLSSNSAGVIGGGVYNDASDGTARVTIVNSTLSGNSAFGPAYLGGGGGGVFNHAVIFGSLGGGATVKIGNTILNAGASGRNIFNFSDGTITSLGYNLSSDEGGGLLTATGDQINTDPLLGPLQDNGGPTFTHALLCGSPAIDAGDPSFTPPPFFDQRGPGYPRVVGGRIDIGAFEVQGPDATPPVISAVSVDKPILWPPNHQLVDVTLNYEVTGNCDPAPRCSLSVTSNEPVNGTGSSTTSPDWVIVDAHHVRLRAERAGAGNGRIYTIVIACTDLFGNSAAETVDVTVSKSQQR